MKTTAEIRKLGTLNLTIGDEGFSGSLGEMEIASAAVGEDTGILKASVKLSYFDAKTGKIKTKTMALSGVTSEGEAIGSLTIKGQSSKLFEAVIE